MHTATPTVATKTTRQYRLPILASTAPKTTPCATHLRRSLTSAMVNCVFCAILCSFTSFLDDDLVVLMNFMQTMPAFANMPNGVKKDLCRSMVYALVSQAGDIVMKDGEQLDSWCVIVSGEVEVALPNKQGSIIYRFGKK